MFNPLIKDEEYFKDKIFVGLVEDNKDPQKKGRIKVRVQSVYDDIDFEHIPWAASYNNVEGKTFSVPPIGKIVNIVFNNGDIYTPNYIYCENYNINLQNKLNNLKSDEYSDFVALLFDHRTQIYSDNDNLRLDYYFNQMSIHKKGINIHLKDNSQKLKLGHDYADQSAVLGDNFFQWFDEFIKIFLIPTTLTGNLGAPILKPLLDQCMTKYQALRPTFVSQHVKIIDNGGCKDVGKERLETPTTDDMTKINNDQILNSQEVPSDVKNNILDKRKNEANTLNENKADVKDKINLDEAGANGEVVNNIEYGDSPVEENVAVEVDASKLDLSDEEFWNIEESKKAEESINSNDKNVEKIDNISDPYDDFWSGYQPRSVESFRSEAPGYGSYTTATDDSDVGISSYSKTVNKSGQAVKKTKYGEIKNGEIDTKLLKKVSGFTIYRKAFDIMLEENAAVAFDELNKAVITKFGKGLDISGHMSHYRTIEHQNELFIKSKTGYAAKPGRSNHGWGLAIDITNFGSKITKETELYKWLTQNSHKYKIWNPDWAKTKVVEPWHWEYYGSSIYTIEK